MSDHIQKTIDDAMSELRKHEAAAIATKKLINHLCSFAKREPMFTDVDLDPSPGAVGQIKVQKNSFYGRPLATCIREYLEIRKKSGGVKEAMLNEIISALREGSFDLSQITTNEQDQPRSVSISLAKNPAFRRLPSGDWGLEDWYETKPKRGRPSKTGENGSSDAREEGSAVTSEVAECKSSLEDAGVNKE